MAPSFSITFATEGTCQSSQLHPADRAATRTPTPSSLVLQLLDDHRPWDLMNNTALVIVDQTYAALLEILGPAAPPAAFSADGHVEISRPVDPADPDSPLLSVNASATHCCICLVNSLHGGTTPEYKAHTPTKRKGRPHYRLASANVSVSPGTLHVGRASDRGSGGPARGWTCADVRPDVSEKGVFGVLETIRARLDAAIRVEARLIEMARASGCKSSKINEVIDVRIALEKMRAELDIDAIMRRRRQKRRRREVQEICSRAPDANVADEYDVLVKRLRVLHVSQNQKRCRPAAEMDQMDDAEVLTKRLRTLQV